MVSGTEIRSWKRWVSLSLQARVNVEALIRVTRGGFRFTGGSGVSRSGTGFGRARVGADDKVSTGGDILASGCDDWRKMMQPNTQSIKGLYWVSQWNPSTIVQPWSNGPRSDKKCQILSFPGRKAYGEVKGLTNDRIGGSVHEAESYWRNVVGREVLSLNEVRVDERVRRSGVHKGFKDRIGNQVGSE